MYYIFFIFVLKFTHLYVNMYLFTIYYNCERKDKCNKMQKEINATIISVLRYDEKNKQTGEKTGKQKIRIDYLMLGKESIQDRENFRGYANLSCFIDYNENIWSKLTTRVIMQPVEMVLEQVPSARDPFKSYTRVNSINTKDEVISLV